MGLLTQGDVIASIRKMVERAGSEVRFARQSGIDRTELNKVLNGHRSVSAGMADKLGLERHVVFKVKQPKGDK